MVRIISIKDTTKFDSDKSMVFFDLETFPDPINHVHKSYACGWYGTEYKQSYGQGCITEFIDYILTRKIFM